MSEKYSESYKGFDLVAYGLKRDDGSWLGSYSISKSGLNVEQASFDTKKFDSESEAVESAISCAKYFVDAKYLLSE